MHDRISGLRPKQISLKEHFVFSQLLFHARYFFLVQVSFPVVRNIFIII